MSKSVKPTKESTKKPTTKEPVTKETTKEVRTAVQIPRSKESMHMYTEESQCSLQVSYLCFTGANPFSSFMPQNVILTLEKMEFHQLVHLLCIVHDRYGLYAH